VNVIHDPVKFSFGFVQFFESQICLETATQEEEGVDARHGIHNHLKSVRTKELKLCQKFIRYGKKNFCCVLEL
jgi:hypothetical protein